MDKLPPNNTDAEENVLGSILIDGEAIRGLNLTPADFYWEGNGVIYEAFKNLEDKGTSINQITVAQELNHLGRLEMTGGAAYLSHLVSISVTSMDCRYYAEIVKRLSTYRRLIGVSRQIEALAYKEDPDEAAVLSAADNLLLDIRKNGASSPIVTPLDRAKSMATRYEMLYKQESGAAVPTGIRDLDYFIGGGLYAGDYAVVAARPGMGKTTLLMNIANYVSISRNVLVCSVEMGVESITDRDVAGAIGISINDVRRGGYDDEIFCKILGAGLETVSERNLYFYRDVPLTTEKIMQAGINMQLRYGLDLLCVDYLGLLDDENKKSPYERVGHISRNIKQISMKLGVPVLIAHQLNRQLEVRTDKRPQLFDLRDSGRIEEDADLVMFLYRDNYYYDEEQWTRVNSDEEYPENIAEIIIAKQRQGPSNKIVRCYYDPLKQQYYDIARSSP